MEVFLRVVCLLVLIDKYLGLWETYGNKFLRIYVHFYEDQKVWVSESEDPT
jgi:hypothetical protein